LKPQSVTVAVFGTGLPQAGIEGAGTGKIPGPSKVPLFSTRTIFPGMRRHQDIAK
jgi:hypothetical protein